MSVIGRMFCLLWAVTVLFDQRVLLGLSVSCALTVHVIYLPVFASVFWGASAFNGDLNQWDVAKVTDMSSSKSIRIV